MKKIIKYRGEGKTTELIKLSAETGAVIITPFDTRYIRDLAREMNLDIPHPLNLRDLNLCQYKDRRFPVLVDEADYMLERLLGKTVVGLSMTKPMEITRKMIADKFNVGLNEFEIVD